MSKNKNKINALVLSVIIAVLSVLGIQTDVYAANNVTGPKYDYNERKWVYSYVYYGMYPQREVVYKGDSAQISALASRNVQSYKKVSRKTWNKIVKAKYSVSGDAKVDGVRYRRIKMTDATQAQSDTPELYRWLDSSSYHYFIYEPVKWKVLEISKGKALLLSDQALDDEKYNDTKAAALMWNIRWKNSTMRSWLNGYTGSQNACRENFSKDNFIDAAFTKSQQKKLIARKMGGNVKDKVFLLYEEDVHNSEVAYRRGFVGDESYRTTCTTYGYAKGIWRPKQSDDQTVMWWLNTDDAGDMVPNVSYYGEIDSDGRNNNKDAIGVRPAIIVSKDTVRKLKVAK